MLINVDISNTTCPATLGGYGSYPTPHFRERPSIAEYGLAREATACYQLPINETTDMSTRSYLYLLLHSLTHKSSQFSTNYTSTASLQSHREAVMPESFKLLDVLSSIFINRL